MALLKKVLMAVFRFFAVLSCLTTVAAVLGAFHFWLFLRLPARPYMEKDQFFIPPKTGAYSVAKLLESHKVIGNAQAFYLLCWLKNSVRHLQAGEYAFSTLYCPEQVLDRIVNGKVVIHTVTLPEGSTLWDVARILEQKELARQDDIIRIATDAEFAKSLEIKAKGLEGYLFPDTYQFKKPVSSALITTTMVKRFWERLPPEWRERQEVLGLSLHEIVILASIVEKEATVDSERPIIAGVFYNRLKINMPLQSDPTAIYDIPGFSGPITAAHLRRNSPYNTYNIKGLPLGPICNPGAQSIRAALHPEKVPYLYFVSNNDGTHHFSVTAEEHRNAVSHYYELKKKAVENKNPANGGVHAEQTPQKDEPGTGLSQQSD